MIKVLIVEDERPIARAIGRLVDQHPACGVIGTESNGQAAVEFLRKHSVDLVITDIQMPVMTGIDLLEIIHREFPQCLAVVLSGYAQFEYARAALQYRAFDYLLKSVTRDNLFRVLDKAEQILQERGHVQQHGLLERALAGEPVIGTDRFYMLLTWDDAEPPWTQPCHWFRREEGRICLVPAEQWSEDLATDFYDHAVRTAQRPIWMIYTADSVSLRELSQIYGRLRRSLLQQARLFNSGLLREDCAQRPALCRSTPLPSIKPERIVEAIRTHQQQTLTELLHQILASADERGALLADAQQYLDSVFSDSRIAYQLPTDQLTAAKQEALSALQTAQRPDACADQMTAILWGLQKQTNAKRDLSEVVDEIAHLLETSYHQHHSAESLAKQYNFVPSYLNKLFRQYKGVRPAEYLLHIRMERAKVILRDNPDVLVKDVAASVGFSDHHYFSKVFKKETGVWPTEYQTTTAK